MIPITKAHAYGNDFLYVLDADVREPLDGLARRVCDRHTGIGADGLITFSRTPDGATMRLFNADGSRAEVSGNGVRGLAAILLRGEEPAVATVRIDSEGGSKVLSRIERDGTRHLFRAAMGLPEQLREETLDLPGRSVRAVVMTFGNPQCVVLGDLPDDRAFHELGPAIERHPLFPDRTNVEFAQVDRPDRVRIRIWERGVGPTQSSGTGSCASLIAAAAFGNAARDAIVIAPGGEQRVEWLGDHVYLTGWAEILFDGHWLPPA